MARLSTTYHDKDVELEIQQFDGDDQMRISIGDKSAQEALIYFLSRNEAMDLRNFINEQLDLLQ